MVGVGTIELIVTHLLLAHWTLSGAVVLSAVSLSVMGWLVFGIASMKRLPVLLDGDALVMRAGRIKGVTVPIARVKGLRQDWSAADLKGREVLNCALLSYPNVVVELTSPLPDRRGTVAIAHRLDDPASFAIALETARSARPVS